MPGIIVFLYIIFLLIAVNNGKKRKNAAGAANAINTAKSANTKHLANTANAANNTNAGRDPRRKPAEKMPLIHGEDLSIAQETHKAVPLEAHMHTTEMGMEGFGSEGTDCCHDYMLRPQEEQKEREDLCREESEPETSVFTVFSDSEEEQAQALLQGVIFSEILGRRPPMGRMPVSRKY